MKETTIDCQRAIVAHGQSPVVAQPSERALDYPSPLVAPQGAPILQGRLAPTLPVRDDRFDTPATQFFAQSITVVATIHDHPLRFLSRAPRTMSPPHAD